MNVAAFKLKLQLEKTLLFVSSSIDMGVPGHLISPE